MSNSFDIVLNLLLQFFYLKNVYSGDLNNELIWYSNGPNLLDRWMVHYSGHRVFDWYIFFIIKKQSWLNEPFEIETIQNQNISGVQIPTVFRCFHFSDGSYSEPHFIRILHNWRHMHLGFFAALPPYVTLLCLSPLHLWHKKANSNLPSHSLRDVICEFSLNTDKVGAQ